MNTNTNAHPSPIAESRPGKSRPGKVKPAILLWALGVPIPFILLFLLVRSCTG